MHTIQTILFSLFLSYLFVGCGTSSSPLPEKESTLVSVPKEKMQDATGVITAGDDQHVIEGSEVVVKPLVLDKSKKFSKIVWSEGDKILSDEEVLQAGNLSVGKHEITLMMEDSEGNVYVDTVVVTIKEENETNHPPKAFDFTITLEEDKDVMTYLRGSDDDGDALSYLLVSNPKHGKLSGSTAHLIYRPNRDYHGKDSFTFKINDGSIDSNIATVSIVVKPVNDKPIFQNIPTDSIEIVAGESSTLDIKVSDVDKDEVRLEINPTWISYQNSKFYINPPSNISGKFNAKITAYDEKGGISSASFVVDVKKPITKHKIAIEQIPQISISEDDPSDTRIINLENETDINTSINYTLDNFFEGLSLSGNIITFNPSSYQYLKEGEVFSSTVQVTATAMGVSDTKYIDIKVIGKNDTPKFKLYKYPEATEGEFYSINLKEVLGIYDIDDDNLTITSSQTPPWITVKDGIATGTPTNKDVTSTNDKNMLIVVVNDGHLKYGSTFAAHIKVINKNDAPIANDDNITTDEDTPIIFNILSNDIDIDRDDNITLKTINPISKKGSVTFKKDGEVTFNPDKSFDNLNQGDKEIVEFNYTISDEHNSTSTAKIYITVNGINDAPVAQADEYSLDEDGYIDMDVLANDSDVDNSILTIFDLNGDGLSIKNEKIHFETFNNFNSLKNGETKDIEFFYKIKDNFNLESNKTSIILHILGKDDAPTVELSGVRDILEGEELTFEAIVSVIDNNTIIKKYIWTLDGVEQTALNNSQFILTPAKGEHNISIQLIDNRDIVSNVQTANFYVSKAIGFELNQTIETALSGEITSLELVDLDNDIDNDIDILISSDSKFLWYENLGNKQYTAHEFKNDFGYDRPAQTVHAADINSDGFLDIIYAKEYLDICFNDQNGTFDCNKELVDTLRSNVLYQGYLDDDNITSISVANLDNSGDVDIVVSSKTDDALVYYKNSGAIDKPFSSSTTIENFANASSNTVADFDNDGYTDIVATSNDGVICYQNDGSGNFSNIDTIGEANPKTVSQANIDDKNNLDILATYTSEIRWYDTKKVSSTSTSFTKKYKGGIVDSSVTNPSFASAVDIDGDGDNDVISSSNISNGAIFWYENRGLDQHNKEVIFEKHTIADRVDNISIVKAVDVNKDNKLDIVAAGNGGKIYIYLQK